MGLAPTKLSNDARRNSLLLNNLMHVLNWCKVALDQGRFTWKHNSVLNHMFHEMRITKLPETTIYADIEGFQINASTIPPDIISTSLRPDLVIINRKDKKIELLENIYLFRKT